MGTELKIPAGPVDARVTAHCLQSDTSRRLKDYPLLVNAPGQHGPGIAVCDSGAKVADIAVAFAEAPDLAALAARFSTVPDAVAQAVNYAYEHGCLVPSE